MNLFSIVQSEGYWDDYTPNSSEAGVLGWALKPICFGSSLQHIAQFSILLQENSLPVTGWKRAAERFPNSSQLSTAVSALSFNNLTKCHYSHHPKAALPYSFQMQRLHLNFLLFKDQIRGFDQLL